MRTWPAPGLLHAMDVTARVDPPIDVSASRRIIGITGGEVVGPRIRGTILAGGADIQLIRADGVVELMARYVIRAEGGAVIYVENFGMRHGSAEAMERLRQGGEVDPRLIYFRTTPRFETASADYQWLAKSIFVGTAARLPGAVELSFYEVL